MSLAAKLRQARAVLSDWRYLPFYAQRRVRSPKLRAAIARNLARLARPAPRKPATSTAAMALREEGFVALGPLLSIAELADIRTWLAAREVADPYRGGRRFLPHDNRRDPDSHVAYHDAADVLACPYLLELANRADILDAVAAFLGCKPTIGYLAAWWSYPTAIGPQQAENFHRDVDDWRFVKLFVHLSEVDDKGGPHIYVHGSAASPKLRTIRRHTDSEIVAAFGSDAIRTKVGPAGTGFLEDTFGFHKGQPVEQGVRLMFQAVYSLFPLPYGPATPIARRSTMVQACGFDPWINRIYLRD